MKALSLIIIVLMAGFTAVSIAFADSWSYLVLVNVGPVSISTFDVVFFGAAVVFVLAVAFNLGGERVLANKLVLGLCWTYVGYQLFVVLPAAVLVHDLRPIDVVREQEVRLALFMIPVVYSVVLRYWKPALVITLFDVAALALVAWMFYSFAVNGPHGYVVNGVFRLRAIWGGGILLFGWLLLTSLFYWPLRPLRMVLAALAIVAIGLANERSGLVACAASFVVAVVAVKAVSKRALLGLALVLVVGIGVYAASSQQVRQSVAYSIQTVVNPSSDQTAQDRVIRSSLGLSYFQQHPLGDYIWNKSFYSVGLGSANFVPHNFVVQLLVTQGVVASVLYFALIGAALFLAWRNRHDRLSAVMLAYLVFYLSFCLLNANIDLRENVSLFFVAVALILHRNAVLSLSAARVPAGAESRAARTAQSVARKPAPVVAAGQAAGPGAAPADQGG